MLSDILKKLIKESFLPVAFLLAAKIISVTLLTRLYFPDIPVLGVGITFKSVGDFSEVNLLSNFAVLAVVFSGLAVTMLRAHFLHNSHVTPYLSQTLSEHRIENWLVTSWEIFPQSAVWLILSWLTFFFIFLQTRLEITAPTLTLFAVLLSFFTAVFGTWLFIFDLERELNIGQLKKEKPEQVYIETETQ